MEGLRARGWCCSGLSLDVDPGEFLTLAGPRRMRKDDHAADDRGAGKRARSRPRVWLTGAGRDPACRRKSGRVNTVFQSYALFPHMTVFQNIAYGLKVLGSQQERSRRSGWMAALSLVPPGRL